MARYRNNKDGTLSLIAGAGNTDAIQAMLNKTSDNIAPKQATNTASKLITAGEYFVNADGDLCQCDVQIASGGTIVVDSNCHVISDGIGNELNSKVASGRNNYTFVGTSLTSWADAMANAGISHSGFVGFLNNVAGGLPQGVTNDTGYGDWVHVCCFKSKYSDSWWTIWAFDYGGTLWKANYNSGYAYIEIHTAMYF